MFTINSLARNHNGKKRKWPLIKELLKSFNADKIDRLIILSLQLFSLYEPNYYLLVISHHASLRFPVKNYKRSFNANFLWLTNSKT